MEAFDKLIESFIALNKPPEKSKMNTAHPDTSTGPRRGNVSYDEFNSNLRTIHGKHRRINR